MDGAHRGWSIADERRLFYHYTERWTARPNQMHKIEVIGTKNQTALLAVENATANEEDGTIDFVVKLSPAVGHTVTVDYATRDVTALAGSDYTETNDTLTFDPGDKRKTVTVALIDDGIEDSGETFKLVLSDPSGASLADPFAVGTILNTDPPEQEGRFSASFEDVPDSHDGSTPFTFKLEFSEELKTGLQLCRTLEDDALELTGGEVTSASRLVKGSNLRWNIRVKPTTQDRVTVVLPVSEDCGLTGAVCTEDERSLASRVKTVVVGPDSVNTPATGAPSIIGTAEVGETLVANTEGISDPDGLDNVSFRYQWIAGGSDIDGATGIAHDLTSSEEGKTIQVRVSFADDAGYAESLTSAEIEAVAAAVTHRPPSKHPHYQGR